jgi:hypothetical protein
MTMSNQSPDWTAIAEEFYGNMPHPAAPDIKAKDYPTAVRLATLAKFGGHASAQEASLFWKEFQGLGMSPSQFESSLKALAPLSYAYHGRPPSFQEIAKFKDEAPAQARDYYHTLPDKHYPEVPAGEMIKQLKQAQPHSQQHLGRSPNKFEASQLHAMGAKSDHAASYYANLKEQK